LLKHKLDRALFLIAQLFIKPDFSGVCLRQAQYKVLHEIEQFWYDPYKISHQRAQEVVYRSHPKGRAHLGVSETIHKITVDDVISLYRKLITPHNIRISVVGNIKKYDVEALVYRAFKDLSGDAYHDGRSFRTLRPIQSQTIDTYLNTKQLMLSYAGLSVNTESTHYYPLMIFDQLFMTGHLANMSSKLFKIREQRGLFYDINGSLIQSSTSFNGMVYIQTIVSPTDLAKAEKALQESIRYAPEGLTQDQVSQGVNAILGSFVKSFNTNYVCAQSFIYHGKSLDGDFYQEYRDTLMSVRLVDIYEAVDHVLNLDRLIKIRVGRI
jgi:predicted Zn-dependent peptidase